MPTIRGGAVSPNSATSFVSFNNLVSAGDIIVVMVNNESPDTTLAIAVTGCTLDKSSFTTAEAQVHAINSGSGLHAYQFAAKVLSVTGATTIQATATNHVGTTRRIAITGAGPDSGDRFASPVVPSRKCEFGGNSAGNPWDVPYTSGAANASPQFLCENNQAGSLLNVDFGSGEAQPRDLGVNACEFRYIVDNNGNISQGNTGGSSNASTQKAFAVGVYSTEPANTQTITDDVGITEPTTPEIDLATSDGLIKTLGDDVSVEEFGYALSGEPEILDITDEDALAILSTEQDILQTIDEETVAIVEGVSAITRGIVTRSVIHNIDIRSTTQRIVVALDSNKASVVVKDSYIIRLSSSY